MYLPSVASRYTSAPVSFVEELLHKAGITEPPYRWIRFECTAWLADHAGERLLNGSFAPTPPPTNLTELVERLAPLGVGYLLRHQRPDGTFFTRYDPLQNQLYEGVDLPRLAHAAWVLARVAKVFDPSAGEAAARPRRSCSAPRRNGGRNGGLPRGQRAFGCRNRPARAGAVRGFDRHAPGLWVPRLAAALWSRIDAHGRLQTHARHAPGIGRLSRTTSPGQVLLALAAATRVGLTQVDDAKLSPAFRYYRHRFRNRAHFGQVSWIAQACHAWWRIKPDPEFAEFAFEVADWILRFQQEKSGAFLDDHQSDTPGYTTAVYLEGLGAVASLARSAGREPRHRTYLEACRRGFQFLDGLIIQSRDTSLLPYPAMAIGGLRRSARRSEVFVDFVQHYLAALIEIAGAAAYNPAHRDRAAISADNSA